MKFRWKDLKAGKCVWRGRLVCRQTGEHSWEVGQDWADPCRLYVPALDAELSYGDMTSDGPSIPTLVCMLFDMDRNKLIRSGFLHDYAYEHAYVMIRHRGGDWERADLDKEGADVILRLGTIADGAKKWQSDLIYWGVRTPFGREAWRNCRKADKGQK